MTNSIEKAFAVPTYSHVSLGKGLRSLLFFGLLIPVGGMLWGSIQAALESGNFLLLGIYLGLIWAIYTLISGVRVAAQWEKGVILKLGKFSALRGPGLFYVIPIFEYVRFIDTRTAVINIPKQKVITRDNVPAEIDGALFFRVANPAIAVTAIEDFRFAIAQYAQASLRDVVGGMSLDELLSEREQIQTQIVASLESRIQEWGLHVDSVRLQDIELPEDLKRMMSRQASAEREKRATITKAEGDKLAAQNLTDAAILMSQNPMSLELRTLQTIDGLGASPSNTVVLFPVELARLMQGIQRVSGAAAIENEGRG
jgi:regulator of protease activity HflC (stomatin/prohibitin superfamily)